MKSIPLGITLMLAAVIAANSQDNDISPEPRILGEIADGTPPPPEAPKPRYQVAAKDILSTATHEQGGRTVTIRQIKPIDLPQPPAPLAPAASERDVEFGNLAEAYREDHPRSGLLFLGATVFRSKDSPPKTLVRYWPQGGGKEITFWTSADYSLIAGGINSFVDTAGDSHHLMIGWSEVDTARMTKLQFVGFGIPEMPESAALADGGAYLHLIGDPPDYAELAPLQSLHELYNKELTELRTAYQGRERARIQREEYLRANPPQPKDITLNFWRTETPCGNAKGASK